LNDAWNLQKAADSMHFTEDHLTADLAILQSLAIRSRIVLTILSGNSSLRVYTVEQIACQFSKAHAEGQDCSSVYREAGAV
jgi:hypothetical protein